MALLPSPWYSTSPIFICRPRRRAIWRLSIMVSCSRAFASLNLSMSVCRTLRYTFFSSVPGLRLAFLSCRGTRRPVMVTVPTSCPGFASTATTSPFSRGSLLTLRKYPLRGGLNCTSTMSQASALSGRSAIQSYVFSLSACRLHPLAQMPPVQLPHLNSVIFLYI